MEREGEEGEGEKVGEGTEDFADATDARKSEGEWNGEISPQSFTDCVVKETNSP